MALGTVEREKRGIMNAFYIHDLLPKGKENAISRRTLAMISGLDERTLRRHIAAERRAGALILSSSDTNGGGYYRPANAEEIRRFVASMTRRGKATFAAIAEARKVLKECENKESERATNGKPI